MFLPIKDDNPAIRTPYVTIGIIVLNGLIYLITDLFASGVQSHLYSLKLGLIPYELTHFEEISGLVAQESIRGYFDSGDLGIPILLTPFTSMFMHGGFMHVAGNMLFLWIYGNNIEDYFGHVRFLLFYLVGGLAASGLYILFSASSPIPLIGASGAISAVLGAYFILYPRARVMIVYWFFFIGTTWLPAKWVLGFYFVVQVFYSVGSIGSQGGGVAYLAHIGGFLFGWALLKLLVAKRGGPQNFNDGGDRHQVYRMKY
jgi:rhomboid family protein